ncbi:MAG: glycosyltransferase family 4 protein [Anaerolineae bacterium]|nr:glycosyltransferase family 4 protein [Anaerolineae bacterium]
MLLGLDASRADLSLAGVGRYSVEMIRHLIDCERHRFRLYANGTPRPFWSVRPHVEWRDLPFPRLWTHIRLSVEMARHAPDVLFVPAHVLPLVRPPLATVTIHDLGFLRFPHCHPGRQRLYLRLSTMWNVRVASAILADSCATRADLQSLLGVPSQRVTVVYPGVSEAFFPQPAQKVARVTARHRLPSQYLLFVGTLHPRKNLLRLLAAHAQVGQAPTLVLAGRPGWMSEPILRRARSAAPRVRLLGPVAEEDLPALMSGATALMLPSLYEGFGIPVLEAMACGTPVIASATSSLPEVVGDAGLLVDPLSPEDIASAMRRVCQEPELVQDLRQRGRARARQFTWRAAAGQALRTMEDLNERPS